MSTEVRATYGAHLRVNSRNLRKSVWQHGGTISETESGLGRKNELNQVHPHSLGDVGDRKEDGSQAIQVNLRVHP